jgi:Leucine-rich repeat (LRR) protein
MWVVLGICVLLSTACEGDHGTTVDAPQTNFSSLQDALNHRETARELRIHRIGDSLAPEIGLLTKLIFLGVYNADIQYLPDEISDLHIGFLWLPNCKFQHIPPQICALSHLGYLILDDNEIESIPEEFAQLKYIDGLSLKRNRLTEFPKEFFGSKNCGLLYLDSNRLTSFDFTRADMPKINHLSLIGNPLPDSVKQRLKAEFGDKVKL